MPYAKLIVVHLWLDVVRIVLQKNKEKGGEVFYTMFLNPWEEVQPGDWNMPVHKGTKQCVVWGLEHGGIILQGN